MVAVGGRPGQEYGSDATRGGGTSGGATILRDILFIVFKRKVPLATLVLLGVAIILYGAAKGEPEYQALARVFVKRSPMGYQMPAESEQILRRSEVINSEIQIITSSAVASAVVDRLGLATGSERALAAERLQRRIKAESPAESDIIDIKYRHTDPEMAAAVVNATLDAYLETRRSVTYNQEAVDFLNRQAGIVRAEIDSIAEQIAMYGGESNQLAAGRLGEVQMGYEQRLGDELITLDTAIASGVEEVALVEAWLASGADMDQVPTGEMYGMSSIQAAKTQILSLQQALEAARSRYAPDHPEVARLERELEGSAGVLRSEVEEALMRQRMELDELRSQRRAALAKLREIEAENPRIAEDSILLRILEHEFAIRSDLYAVIMDRREQFRITTATDPTLLNIGIVSRASVPAEPTPQAVNMRVVVGLFTIFFGVMLVMALEHMEHTLERPEDVERALGVKVLAWLPERGA